MHPPQQNTTPMSNGGLRKLILELSAQREPWRDDAACLGMPVECFFPEHGHRPTLALQICQTCKVREPCLKEANTNHDLYTGVWGGTTHSERKRPSYRAKLKRTE